MKKQVISTVTLIGRVSILLFTVFFYTNNIVANTIKKEKTRLNLSYFYNADNTSTLEAKLTTKKDERTVSSPDMPILFYLGVDSGALIGKAITDKDGKASVTFGEELEMLRDTAGYLIFYVEFEGNDEYKSSSKDVAVKEARLEMSFFQRDSVKSILLKAWEVGTDGENIPLDKVDISFYVPRTYSLLEFSANELENGECIVAFPTDIPGNEKGELTIIAKIVDSDDYGTVSTKGIINWGTNLEVVHEAHRGLGDVDAPLWMVYTLIVLMSGVWGHYVYVLYSIYMIKREEKNID